MRVSKIKRLCREEKVVYLTDQKDPVTGEILQYVGDPVSLYPLRGFPYLEPESLLAILDIPVNERKNWNVRHTKDWPDWISTEDVGADIILRRLRISIGYDRDYAVYEMGHTRLITFYSAYLRPLEGDISIVWRFLKGYKREDAETEEGPLAGYIVAKSGMFFEACWMPAELPVAAQEELKKIAGRI